VFDVGPAGDENLEYVIAARRNLMGRRPDVERRAPAAPVRSVQREAGFPEPARPQPEAEGVQIFIGHESGYQVLDDCTVITAPYAAGNSVMGVLGVIGPTRMAYERVIPIVT